MQKFDYENASSALDSDHGSASRPEKTGVGGSIPSLATIIFNNLEIAKTVRKLHRAHNTRTIGQPKTEM
jgi:hypothetical protein